MLWAITGASGYVGDVLVKRLRASGAAVRALYRVAPSTAEGIEAVAGDLENVAALDRLVTGADVVVHLAAYVHRRAETKREKDECYRANVVGTKLLIDSVERCAPDACFVNMSSANVYPTSDQALSEAIAPEPRSYYGATKLEGEQAVLEAIGGGRLKGVILRPSLVFGPGGPGNLARLVGVLRRRLLPTLDGGLNRKSLVPVEMLVDAIIGLATIPDRCSGEIYNVTGATLTLQRIAEIIAEELGVRPLKIPLPVAPTRMLASIGDRFFEGLHIYAPNLAQIVETYTASTVISDEKLRRILPLGDQREVEAALRAMVRTTCRGKRSAGRDGSPTNASPAC